MSKKAVILTVVVAVVLAGGGAIWAANHNTNSSNNGSSNSMGNMDMNNSDNSNSGNSTAPAATDSVTIQNFAFSPADITVKKGTTVTWTNKDSATHTVTETDTKTGPDSGDLATGKSYSFTYEKTGLFKYHCSIHPNMTGTVTVTE